MDTCCHSKRHQSDTVAVSLRYRIDIQTADYDSVMQMKAMTLRVSSMQRAQLEKLSEKLQISVASVIRQAIARMAEEEGISAPKKK